MKIKNINLSHLRGEAHLQFHSLVKALLEAFPDVKAEVAAPFAAYAAVLRREAALIDAVKASDYTRQLAEADHRLDRTLVGINSTVEAALHHFDPAVVEAARKLHLMLKTFRNAESKAYEEEIAAVKLLVVDLHSDAYAPQAAQVGLTPWVAELAEAAGSFEALFNRRNVEYAGRPQDSLRSVRKETDNLYRHITERIGAAIIINGEAHYAAFAEQLNEEILYFNEHSHHHAKHDLAHAAVDEIPAQPFAGAPITPIPVVRYTEAGKAAVALTFAKDFTLTYKDNDRAGTAEVIIHGKGAYKGAKAVTFNIV